MIRGTELPCLDPMNPVREDRSKGKNSNWSVPLMCGRPRRLSSDAFVSIIVALRTKRRNKVEA